MFQNALVFNQDVSGFDTSKVVNVRDYLCCASCHMVELDENQILIPYSCQNIIR